eukprot:CAMPEP_0194251372 /NCGR_PEP_ID=MMETSP0158-20130606/25284_1 /TAXON_ID=33649 /ORGANISM="Thalassionema nitzschioides, Strain L26-B" /LENGTH=69 /DNA_ID=CAMNT_0038988495 /DNA_START=450 /DNA_END=656 /DNA_ORIENTATION=-
MELGVKQVKAEAIQGRLHLRLYPNLTIGNAEGSLCCRVAKIVEVAKEGLRQSLNIIEVERNQVWSVTEV